MRRNRSLVCRSLGMIALGALILTLTPRPALAKNGSSTNSLRLRVHKVIGEAGGRTTVVLRTYAPRDIDQGQICLNFSPSRPAALRALGSAQGSARASGETGVIASIQGARVFSGAGDAVGTSTLESFAGGQRVTAIFSSASATINSVEGALIAIEVDLAASTGPGDVFDVSIDPDNTLLFDAQGVPLTVSPRSGDLSIRASEAHFRMEMEGDTVPPGEVAAIGLATFEPFAAANGQIALVYDPAVFPGTPIVAFDARHGNVVLTVDSSIPGLLFISFTSPDASFNDVPGKIVTIELPSAPGVPIGTSSAVDFDLSQTFLLDSHGNVLSLNLKSDQVDFE